MAMPNFVKNKIIVGNVNYGKRLVEKYSSLNEEEGKLEFDFNKVIKMPEELQIEFSTKSDDALSLYLTKINPEVKYYGAPQEKVDKASYDKFVEEVSKTTTKTNFTLSEDDIYRVLDKYKEESKLLALGERQVKNLLNYNALNWYDWSIKNWGTKWNASEFEVQDDFKSLLFETAWDPAIEVMLEISRQNPDIRFAFLWSDEDIGAHLGYMLLQGGRIDYKGTFEDFSVDAYKLAFSLWGHECESNYEYSEEEGTYVYKD